jgi:hypothetical protein
VIPDEAVEAAQKAYIALRMAKDYKFPHEYAKAMLEAAAPHLLKAAAAGALRDAAGAVTPPDTDYPEAKKVRDWLLRRAATIESAQ